MLDNSLKLQILKITYTANDYNNRTVYSLRLAGEWKKRPKSVPELMFVIPSCNIPVDQLPMGTKRRARRGKIHFKECKMVEESNFTEPEDVDTLEEKREMLNELARVRASNLCHLVFESSSN